MLDKCIRALQAQEVCDFTCSIVIVDNDISESARGIFSQWQKSSSIELCYDVEPEPNISLARNRAVRNAAGDLIAFIDDDEVPQPDWLLQLYCAYAQFSVDGVLGPVLPSYEGTPPEWLLRSGLCTRKSFATGTIIRKVKDMRTGNVLFGRHIINGDEIPFDPQFGRTGGEDTDFFKRQLSAGRSFVWCDEARVYECVPLERQKVSFFVKRAFILGTTAADQEDFLSLGTMRSAVAVIAYAMCLPVLLVGGYHLFMTYFIKWCNHFAKLLARLGVKVVRERTS